MKRQRRKHSPEFKVKVALGAIQGIKTLSEIAQEYESHPFLVVDERWDHFSARSIQPMAE